MKRILFSIALSGLTVFAEAQTINAFDIEKRQEPTQQQEQESVKQDGRNGKIYDVVEQMPSFPGGMSALMQYLSSNIRYPQEAKDKGIQGRVICTFVVECDGSVSNIRVVKPVSPSLDKEAVRLLEYMPRWNPGRLHGETVRTRYTLPISFRL